MNKLLTFLFGKPNPGDKVSSSCHTIQAVAKPSEYDWYKEFNVGLVYKKEKVFF